VQNYRSHAVRFTDHRIELMSEILLAVKLVKFYAWEAPFATRISEARSVEVTQVWEGNKQIDNAIYQRKRKV
jgi:hypothetical protein